MTIDETKALQTMFFRHPGGRVLERELREIGHIDSGIDSEEARIEHNTVKRILTLMGCNIQFGRETIRLPQQQSGTEQDSVLGVKETPNA